MIKVSPYMDHCSLKLFTFSWLSLPTEFTFILTSFCSHLFSIEIILLLISFLQFGVQILPHIANYSGNISHSIIGVFLFDTLINVHSVEKESTKCLFWWFRRNSYIIAIRHGLCDLSHLPWFCLPIIYKFNHITFFIS